MGTFVSLMLGSAIVLALLYMVYRWAVSGSADHAFNRVLLLCMYPLAFIALPLWGMMSGFAEADPAPDVLGTVAEYISYDEADPLPAAVGVPAATAPLWPVLLVGVYLAGVLAVGVLSVRDYLSLRRLVRSGRRIVCDGYDLVVTDRRDVAPLSWGRTIVINSADYEASADMILAHERHHIAAGHRHDLVLAQIVIIINWFNPAAWLMRDELRAVHEYQADIAVLGSGADSREYQMLLIRKSAGIRFSPLADNLNDSKIKKRITMMQIHEKLARRRMRAAVVIPAVAAAMMLLDMPAVASVLGAVDAAELPRKEAEPVKAAPADTIEYYVDGIRVPAKFIKAITPEAIKSIDVDKSGKRISFTLKEDDTLGKGEPIKVVGYGSSDKRVVRRTVQFEPGSVGSLAATPDGEVTITWNDGARMSGRLSVYKAGKPEYYIDGVPADIEAVRRIPVDSISGIHTGSDKGMYISLGNTPSPLRRVDLNPADVKEVYVDGVKADVNAVNALNPSMIRDIYVKKDGGVHIHTKK